jgi:hypothetical protein
MLLALHLVIRGLFILFLSMHMSSFSNTVSQIYLLNSVKKSLHMYSRFKTNRLYYIATMEI